MLNCTKDDIRYLEKIGQIVAEALYEMLKHTKAGITPRELDAIGLEILQKYKARSAPQICYNFPGATCISVEHVAAHGIPDDTPLKNTDIVNIDVSAELNGYFADTGASIAIDGAPDFKKQLCKDTHDILMSVVHLLTPNTPFNEIGKFIESQASEKGYSIIRNLMSHGVGRSLHEDPHPIPTYYNSHDKRIIEKGMVFTLEPFLSNGCAWAEKGEDGWALLATPHYAAQFEHTFVITDGKPLVITTPPS